MSKSNRTLIKGGHVLCPGYRRGGEGGAPNQSVSAIDGVMDILIEDGKIAEIAKNITPAKNDDVVELTPDLWVTPGLIDIHVHFRDPGRSEKETTATGAKAAIAGGFTTVCVMPNTTPVIDSVSMLEYLKTAAAGTGITIHPVPAVTKGLEGKQLTSMGTLVQNGAVGFTDDGCPIESASMMRKALEYSKMFDIPIICHAEDTALCGCGVMHEGFYSTKLGLPGIPSVAESTMVARDILLARDTGGHVHFAHLSCKESVELVRQAKKEGLRVTAETTPHNLALTDADLVDYNPNFKMYGPLRSEDDRQALIAGIKDGTIDAIATDHAPHTPEEKALTFDEAPRGVIGLESALGVILTNFYHTQQLTALEVIQLMSTGPAQCYKLKDAGVLSVGARADITVIDPNHSWVVDPQQFKSKSRNCPFNGKTLTGKAVQVFSAGILVSEPTKSLAAV